MNTLVIVTGSEYAALIFEKEYHDTPIEWLKENVETIENKMLEELDDFEIKFHDTNISASEFTILRDIWGDYDMMKHENAYLYNGV